MVTSNLKRRNVKLLVRIRFLLIFCFPRLIFSSQVFVSIGNATGNVEKREEEEEKY